MDRSPSDESHEWKSIRSELCGMLEQRLDGEDAPTPAVCQRGRGYVRLRAVAAHCGETGGLLRLKHRQKLHRAHVGPFDHQRPTDLAGSGCACPECGPPTKAASSSAARVLSGNGRSAHMSGDAPQADGPSGRPLRSLRG